MNIEAQIKTMTSKQVEIFKDGLLKKGLTIDENYDVVKIGVIESRSIEPVPTQDSYIVSHAQRRLWVLDQFENDSIAYNMPAAIILEGKLENDAFNEAYSFMIRRHESLRTVFVAENGKPRQKILKNPDFDIDIIDLRDSLDVEKEARVIAEKDLQTPFNLEVAPLVRFTIIRLENEKNLLLFNMHHIISDGWSMSIFINEFLIAYNSYKVGNTPGLAPLRIHYKDYSGWQNDLLKNSDMNDQREYWLEKLSGELPVLDIPADYIRPVTQTFNGNNIGFVFQEKVKSGLNNLCLKNEASLFMILQALVKVLFHRYTGQEDIILGSPIAGRVHEDLENQIGFYVNNLVLRDTIEGDLTFKEFLESVKKTCTDAFDHQDYPFDSLVEELDLKRDISRSPLFDVMVVLQNNETSAVGFDGLNLSSYSIQNTISKFDMTFNFSETGEGLFCGIEYNTDLYSEDRINRMTEHLKILISSVLENPESRIKNLDIISEEEKNLFLNVFNNTATDYPMDKTIVDLFEEQVEKTPDSIAVIFEDIKLTYRELNEKINIVGHYIRDNYDIKPDDLVGVLLNRSENMLIALLGILKSGGAYVPLDPEYPVDRIDFMLKDSCPKVVISERDLFFENDIEILDINEVLQSDQSLENPGTITNPDHLAYVIYTSGSTGKPKGTLIEHKSLINRIDWMQKNYSIGENDTILQKTTYTFDVSVWELFWWSLYGAKVCFLKSGGEKDPEKIIDVIERNSITTMHFVPSMYSAFLLYIKNNKSIGRIKSLNQIFCSGEELTVNHVEESEYIINQNETKLINLYGPTEATIDVTYFNCKGSEIKIPIGKPISNITLYIVDNNNNPIPLGVAGELCISGVGLAREYLNRPELTAEKFVENPFLPEERMYRTGDLARWLPDGNIEFLGRIDNQVKIRGFRIEIGEIENALIQQNEINSVVVMVKEGTDGVKQLIAYYASDNELEPLELRSFLKKSLPDYMVPSYFVCLEKFPITPNGKVDRNALPEPIGSISTSAEYVAPRDELEETLVEIWQEVLGVRKIGILDDFLELGGESLKAIQIMSRLSQENIKGDITSLFSSLTIKEFALSLKEFALSLEEETIIIDQSPVTGLVPLSPIQKWFLNEFRCPKYHFSHAVMLRFKESINGEKLKALRQSANKLIQYHDALRMSYNQTDKVIGQENRGEIELNFEEYDLRSESNPIQKIGEIATSVQNSLYLENDILIRFVFFNLKEGVRLLIVSHLLIIDDLSWRILVEDLESGFKQFLKGDEIKFPTGKQISNISLYILDNDKLAPPGVEGELCISGTGLSLDYLSNLELSSEDFVENPFIVGMKMYRTGDRARWLPKGNIEFLGRI